MIKNVKRKELDTVIVKELNISIATVFLNIQTLKMI